MSADDASQALIDAATATRANAYAPYSHFPVGAALRLLDGSIHVGVNVESCAYPLSVCAERHAVAAAIANGAPPGSITDIAVVADSQDAATPCGACRQVLVEHAAANARVIMHNLRDGNSWVLPLADLLPHAFGPKSLP